MLTDLVQIRRLGEKARPENERFRRHLKSHNFADRTLRRLAGQIEERIDCRSCANCCRVATARIIDRDVEKLARFLRLPPARFLAEYTVEDAGEGRILKRAEGSGCVFLSGNECLVYEARPASCVDFPHTVRGAGSIASRMWQFIDRATYCPIVYHTLEAWKEETRFLR